MKLIGDFYNIEKSVPVADGMVYGFDVRLNPEHFIFKAHFPGHPITPGVCLMQMVAELASVAEGCNLFVRNIKNVKYTGVVSPDDNTRLSFIFTSRTETGDGGLKVQTLVTAAGNPGILYSKFSVTLVKEQF